MIRCRVLGPVEVSVDGAPPATELLWKKNLGLLLYLALAPGQGRSREHLVGLLWGDKPEQAARHSLNEALRVLRRSAGEAHVRSDTTSVALLAGGVELDTGAFASHEAAERWAEAAALVRGGFLEGLSVPGETGFEDWLAAERAQWDRRAQEVLVRASSEALGVGDAPEATALAERAVRLAPLSGRAAAALMRALAVGGHRGAALERLEAHTAALADQLGTTPDPDVVALGDRIRRGQLGPAPDTPAASVAATRRLPLAGRGGVMARLTGAWAGATAQRRTSVEMILADAGLGKTRLAEEMADRVALEGGVVIRARGMEGDAAAPWSGLIGLGRGGLLEAPGIAAAPAAAHAALAAEIPEWGDRYRGSAGVQAAPMARALTELLRAACDERPLLVVADDCQLLDAESIGALAALPRDLPGAPLLLLLTADPAIPAPPLDGLRAQLGRDVPGGTTTLDVLDRDGLTAMARAVFPAYDAPALERLTRRLAADSAGVPLLAIEILHAVAAGLDLTRESGAWPAPYHTLTQTSPGDLPDTVVAAIRVGYRRLSEPAQAVLAAAAALGGRVTPEQLARAVDLPLPAVHAALDEVEWQRWLSSDARGYAFVAAIVERVIERDMLTPGKRRRIRDGAAPN